MAFEARTKEHLLTVFTGS